MADKGGTEQTVAEVKLEHSENGKILFTNDIYLRAKVEKGCVVKFYYSLNGKKFRPLDEEFTATAGVWIGAKVDLFATTSGKTNDGGWLDVDYMRMTAK